MTTALDWYRRGLASYEDLLPQLKNPREIKECEEEIEHFRAHIHRLETDHAECTTPCCLGCKLGGLPPEKRGTVGIIITETE